MTSHAEMRRDEQELIDVAEMEEGVVAVALSWRPGISVSAVFEPVPEILHPEAEVLETFFLASLLFQ